MGKTLGVFVAMEQEEVKEDEPVSNATNAKITLVLFGGLMLIGVGIAIGYFLWSYHGGYLKKMQPGQNTQAAAGVPSDTQSLFDNTAQTANQTDPNSWETYTDPSFTIKYPKSWQVKKGFSSKDDLVLYDPTSIKSSQKNGAEVRTPAVFLDILLVQPASQSAQALVADLGKQNHTEIPMEMSPVYKENMVLYSNKVNTTNNIAWTQNNTLAFFSTSAKHLTDDTMENKILGTFQLVKK